MQIPSDQVPGDSDCLDHSKLKLVLLYEELPEGKLAMTMFDQFARQLGNEFQIQKSIWKLDLLNVPRLRDVAAVEAVHADFVLIALQAAEDLPRPVEKWMRLWLTRREDRPCALITLIHGQPQPASTAVASLKKWAEKGGLDFFGRCIPGQSKNDRSGAGENPRHFPAWEGSMRPEPPNRLSRN